MNGKIYCSKHKTMETVDEITFWVGNVTILTLSCMFTIQSNIKFNGFRSYP